MLEKRNAQSLKLGNLKARDQLEKLGADEMVILKGILKKQCERAWALSIWLRIRVIWLLS